jgi:hypothetical protein
MLNYLHFKTLYSGRQNLDAIFLINFFKNKIDCCCIMDTADFRVYPLSKLGTFLALTSVMSQDLALQQGASRLQTTANVWTFSINITSPLRMHFSLLNPTELHLYRVTCVTLLHRITFLSSSSSNSSLSLAFVVYIFSVRLL